MTEVEIWVIRDLCDGCEECVLSCTAEVLEMREGKAVTIRHEDCLVCRTCEQLCPTKAIICFEKPRFVDPQSNTQ